MAKKKIENKKPIEQYEHTNEERLNNPPVGLVTAHSDNGGTRKKTYEYDPHLDPQLQWAGKTEHTSFEVNTVSLHVHERIDPRRIIESVKKCEVGSEKWVVDSSNNKIMLFDDFKKLSGINSLAEINGLGGTDISDDQNISEGRNLRTDKSDAKSSSIRTEQHSRGAIAELYRTILAFHKYSTGEQGGAGNADNAGKSLELCTEGELRQMLIALSRDKKNATFARQLTKLANLNTSHFPLSTSHFTLPTQPSLFEVEKKPLRQAVEFYKHREGWSNRLVAGDSLLVMNSLLEKEGMAGKVQMVYFDPPYGIKYGSNFQPFVNKRDVKDGKDEDLTTEPEMIKAFRDTWELGIHSYLTYLRDRLLLARELLHESGSVFVQISDENVHLVRCIMDEVFGVDNFVSLISFSKTTSSSSDKLGVVNDYLIWFSKNINSYKYRQLFLTKIVGEKGATGYNRIILADGSHRALSTEEQNDLTLLPKGAKICMIDNITSQRPAQDGDVREYMMNNVRYTPGKGTFKTDLKGLQALEKAKRLYGTSGDKLGYVRYLDDFPAFPVNNIWTDTVGQNQFGGDKLYVVQTALKSIQRCLLMTTDPGDLVLDITCGSGTTAYVAEQWGRRWITCDTSRVAITLAKQRLMTAMFDYYELAHASEGVGSGFKYKTVPHITLKSIANNEPAPQETLYDQPFIDKKRCRVTGPFTVEAVPSPVAKSFDDHDLNLQGFQNLEGLAADNSISRSGETLRQTEWLDKLKVVGIRGKGGNKIEFSRLETLSGTRYIQAEGETKDEKPKKVMVVFGPEHAPLEKRTVEEAMKEARWFNPQLLILCAFQIDEGVDQTIEEMPAIFGFDVLKVQINIDLQTEDLKKKTRDDAFFLIGQPDVQMNKQEDGTYTVEVNGFDYYNPKDGNVISGGKNEIAMWMLDTDYDGMSIFPTQVFFPMSGAKDGWSRLAKNLKAEIDEEKIEAYRRTVSLPFAPGKAVAVKIIDARGIESLKIIRI